MSVPQREKIGQRLSVALCVYNGAAYIREQLDSIAAQERLPDELVVCDDRSTDRTAAIVEGFASEVTFPVGLFVNEENLGYTKNLERAIRLSTGDVIFPSDHDDVWRPEKLKRAEKVLSSFPHVGAVFSNAEIVDEQLNSLGYSLWQSANFSRSRQKRFARGRAFEVLLKSNVVYGATMGFRSTFKDLVLPISSAWDADEWIALLISTVSELAVIHEPLIEYRQHPKNLSGGRGRVTFGDRLAKARQPDQEARLTSMIRQHQSLYERLSEAAGQVRDPKDLSILKDKIEHLKARAETNTGSAHRLLIVFRELAKLRYHRHSNGWKSAAKDLLL